MYCSHPRDLQARSTANAQSKWRPVHIHTHTHTRHSNRQPPPHDAVLVPPRRQRSEKKTWGSCAVDISSRDTSGSSTRPSCPKPLQRFSSWGIAAAASLPHVPNGSKPLLSACFALALVVFFFFLTTHSLLSPRPLLLSQPPRQALPTSRFVLPHLLRLSLCSTGRLKGP